MDQATLPGRLNLALADAADGALQQLAGELGFAENQKTAINLRLLHETLADPQLLGDVITSALATADPDLALNNLERLASCLDSATLQTSLRHRIERRQCLTILGASPFLSGILCRNQAFFGELFGQAEINRSKDLEIMLGELRPRLPDAPTFSQLQAELRRYKQREILRIGARDLCGLADLAQVTAELSALAAASLQVGYEACSALLQADCGPPRLDPESERAAEPEFVILGMGKFGGWELNFSSDIDLIYFYSSERGMTDGIPDPTGLRKNRLTIHQYFCKLGELITRAISQATEDGFVFRVDLRLRPGGNSGEMANSLRSAEVYYESWGQSWERAALLKARPVAGSLPFGERLLQALEPFIYRRYLDYAMIEDIKVMKQKIDRSLTREREGELNLKLGRGGIREIEFFIQAIQLIYAGKTPELRERSTLRALDMLLSQKLIRDSDHRHLRQAYIFLRTVEHRIQIERERQTHNLPGAPRELQALARRCGFADAGGFSRELEQHRRNVQAIYRDLFFTSEEAREEIRPEVAFLFDPAADPDLVKDLLEEKGFRNVDGVYESLLALRDGPPHRHLTPRARRHLERIAPLLMQEVIDSPEPDMALLNLERFISALQARATFYALLSENREIVRMLVSLFGTSQYLSRILIQHAEILDSLVARSYAVIDKDRLTVEQELTELIDRASDYEERLDVLRRFRNEEFLRIALNDIQGQLTQAEGTVQLSQLADACLKTALRTAREELLPRYGLPCCSSGEGEPHEADFAILGMGKLGGMELAYHSDLDIIFIYEGEGETRPVEGCDPQRFRPQSNQEYFSKLAQRIISILTLITREGYVYQIDTRLRPSGNQGPLVTSLPAFIRYHESSAQPWERQALIKARVVVGADSFAKRIEQLCQSFVYERPLPPELAAEIYRLRGRMETEIAREGAGHLNIKTGRGGMVDVEFLTQYLQLRHGGAHPRLRVANTLRALELLRDQTLLDEADFATLDNGYRFLRRLENRLRLVHDQSISELASDRAYLIRLARRLGYPERPRRPDEVLLQDYHAVTEKIRTVFDRILAPADSGNSASPG